MFNSFKKLNGKNIFDVFSLLYFHIYWFFYLKFKFFKRVLSANYKNKVIFFYPKKPDKRFVVYKICHFLGYSMTENLNSNYDLAINMSSSLPQQISYNKKFLNFYCTNLTKKNVESIFEKVFGYKLSVNPLSFKGKCVKKPNQNASGVGSIIQCPIKDTDKDSSYQKLINSEDEFGNLVNFRVPIFNKNIPLVYLRFKEKEKVLNDVTSRGIKIKSAIEVFSKDELKKIFSFCKELGMDYGELDILRDKTNKKIYIVDANNTPFGPHYLPKKETEQALIFLSQAFENEFF